MTKILKGIAASDGVAIAKAYLLVQPDLSFSKSAVDDVNKETDRLQNAIDKSNSELQQIRDIAAKSLG
jgi:phosphotransferase system enzyme I (PtsI)